MSDEELDRLIDQYEERFGVSIPDGMIDMATLAKLITDALEAGTPITDTSDFVA